MIEEILKIKAQESIDDLMIDLSAKWIVNSSKKQYSEDDIIFIKMNIYDLINRIEKGGEKKC